MADDLGRLSHARKCSSVPKTLANNYETTVLVIRDTLRQTAMRSCGDLPSLYVSL